MSVRPIPDDVDRCECNSPLFYLTDQTQICAICGKEYNLESQHLIGEWKWNERD